MHSDRLKLATSPTPISSPRSFRSPTPSTSSSGLPPPANAKTCMSAAAKRWKYLRRILHFRQMDFEFAFWQMIYLISAPQQVYRNFQYRKQTKLQFARDDPAFLVLLSGWLVISTAGFALVLNLSFLEFFKLLLYVIFVDCIGVGLVVATFMWWLCNKHLIKPSFRESDVEWGFAFDVHLNAFFPILLILHFVQLFFYHLIINKDLFVATLFGNTLWLVAIGYYIYITFLGYSSLNILKKTKVFLYPFFPLVIFYIGTLVINWNLSKTLMNYYENRVL